MDNIHGNLTPAQPGWFTFNNEGTSDPESRYFSRKAHWPGGASGVTIGRGYDLGHKLPEQIMADLEFAGIPRVDREKFVAAAGITGTKARAYLLANELPVISEAAELKLFERSYSAVQREVQRIVNKDDVESEYGKTDWDSLNPVLREMLIDLHFRGDYTPGARKLIQPHVAENDLMRFADVLSMRSAWRNVPQERFNRRVEFLESAIRSN